MDGNKDEALKCIAIAKDAIASGNKPRALKFIRIAQRLNHNMSVVNDLLSACEKMDLASPSASERGNHVDKRTSRGSRIDESSNVERSYTEEHVQLISEVNKHRDYYAVLGVEKSCSGDEIRKAYRKLSLKVHPDKNQAPGAEEAFKKVSKAFKCLSEEDSRRQYDQTGLVDEFEYNQQHNAPRRRRRGTTNDLFEDNFDPDEIFRAFFGQSDMFRAAHVYRARGTATPQRTEFQGRSSNFMLLIQLVPFLLILLFAYLPFSEPEYSLQRNYTYQIPRVTETHGVEYYVKSLEFDRNYPIGSVGRENIEDNIIQEYKNLLGRYCHVELQRRQWSRNLPTPHCDRLQNFGLA